MGCDIHISIEYENHHGWHSLARNLNPGRYYKLFGILAGVRGGCEDPVAAGRGVPEDAAYMTHSENRIYVCDDYPGERHVSREKAEEWIQNGHSKPIEHNGRLVFVTDPDWHSHSWCTTDEFARVVERAEPSAPYHAVLAAMRQFEAMDIKSRLVFWFDN